MMRVLLCGASGQLGSELRLQQPDAIELTALTSAQLDISNVAQVADVVRRLQPQVIINAAAYTAVDKAESEPGRAFAVNRDGIAYLAAAAIEAGAILLHVSTDYVFPGDASQPYREEDLTGPAGAYGASKLAGEQAMLESGVRGMILRTSWVFSAWGNNFVKTMLRLGCERDRLGVVADQQGCPTSAASIAAALWQLVAQYQQRGELPWGLYHYSGTPACSWHEFAMEIFSQAHALGMLTKMPEVRAIASSEYPTPAQRPAWSVLDCSKLQQACGIVQADWRDELGKVLRQLQQQG